MWSRGVWFILACVCRSRHFSHTHLKASFPRWHVRAETPHYVRFPSWTVERLAILCTATTSSVSLNAPHCRRDCCHELRLNLNALTLYLKVFAKSENAEEKQIWRWQKEVFKILRWRGYLHRHQQHVNTNVTTSHKTVKHKKKNQKKSETLLQENNQQRHGVTWPDSNKTIIFL